MTSLWSDFLIIILITVYNLLTLNVNGLNDHIKRTALIDWLKCMKADIVCLQKTHASSHTTILSWFRNSGFRVASSSLSNKRCGVAILTQVRKMTMVDSCRSRSTSKGISYALCPCMRQTRTRCETLSFRTCLILLTWQFPLSSVAISMPS